MVACSGIGVGARPCPIVAPPRPRLSATRPPARPSFGRLAPPLGARTRLPRGNLARAVGDRESGGKAGDGTDAERGRGRDKALSPSKPPPPEPIATSPPPPPPSRWARLLAALAGIPWLRLVRLAIHAIIIGWLLDAVPLALFANPSSPPAVAFSDFVEGVNRGEVARLQVDGATVLFSVHESSQLGQAARRFQGQLSTGPAASKPSSGASSSSSGAVEKANRFLGFSGGRRSIDSSTPSTRPGPPPVRRKSASTVALATVRPADYPMPYALLAQQGVAVWAAPPQPSLLRRTITVVLASAAALLGLLSLLRLASPLLGALAQRSGWAPGRGAAAQGAGGARASFDGSRSTRFSDVAGMPEAKQELAEVVDMLRHPAKYAALGARPPSGVLLSGPPGTGKTLLARAVAGEAGVPFFAATASEFVELYVGMGALRVRSLFAAARRHPAAIVFIDELDAVGKSRESRLRAASNDEREQTLNQLLAELDGFEGANKDGRRVEGGEGEGKGQDKKRRSLAGLFGPPSRPSSPPLVICIAATNRPDVLDAALLRPGRFDRRVSVGLPDSQGRAEILQAHLARQGLPLAPDVDVRQLASDSAGSSGADLANVVNEAALMAARRVVGDGQTTRAAGEGAEPIEQDRRQSDASAPPGPPSCSPPTLVAQADFTEALLKTLMGPPRARGLASSLERQAVAVHEAGHAAVRQACRVLLPHTPPPSRVSVRPRVNGAAGFTQMAAPEEDRTLLFEAELRAELAVLLAGRAAERACGGGAGASSGAEDDLRRATALARRAAGVYGLSEAIGPVSVEGLGEGEGGWSKEVEREVGSMLRRAQAAALEVVRANEQVVRGLADELLREELVEGGKLKEHLAGVVATEGLREFVSNSGCDSKCLPVEGAASGQLVFSHSNSGKGT